MDALMDAAETRYSDQVIELARQPQNMGYIESADGVGVYENQECGDYALMTLLVRNGRVAQAAFLTRCCGPAIAALSMATQLAQGKNLYEVDQINAAQIAQELNGLPPDKLHCAVIAAAALHAAIADYRKRHQVNLRDWRAAYRREAT
jgi:nitrogen fixation NifU-like protein